VRAGSREHGVKSNEKREGSTRQNQNARQQVSTYALQRSASIIVKRAVAKKKSLPGQDCSCMGREMLSEFSPGSVFFLLNLSFIL